MKTRTPSPLTLLAISLFVGAAPAPAATKTWSGGGADNNMANGANWYGLAAPLTGDDLVFGAASRQSPVDQLTISNFNSIAFTNGGFSLEAQSDTTKFVLAAGLTNRVEASSAGNTNRVAIYLTNALTIVNDATRTLNFNPDDTYTSISTTNLAIDNKGYLLTFDGAGNITFGSTTKSRGAYIRGSGGLTKNGAGILTLNGTNTYTGDTVVNEGALVLTTAPIGAGAIIVADGAQLGITAHAAGATLRSSRLALGATLGGAVTNDFNLSTNASSTAPVVYATNLMATGNVYVNVTGTVSQTNYPLIKYSSIGGDGFGAFKLGALPPGVAGTLTNNTANNSVDLNVTLVAGSKVWTAANGTPYWDISATVNWKDAVTGTPATYNEYAPFGDVVRFDDSAGSATVELSGKSVKPYSITVSNSALSYSIAGVGLWQIAGTGFLVKQGAGALLLPSANTFSGGSTMSAGLLKLGNNSALGSGLVTLAGGSLSSDSATARTPLNAFNISASVTLGDAVNNGVLTLAGPVNFNNGTRSLTVSSDVVMTGGSTNGRINKLGGAKLTLKGGVHDWNGTAEVRGGLLVLDATGVTNTSDLRPDCAVSNATARLVITNGAHLVMTGTANNLRAGNDGNATTTNYLDIAGTVRMPNVTGTSGRLNIGRMGAGIVNLLPGGDAQVRWIASSDDTTVSNYSEFNFSGGVLRPIDNRVNFMEGLTNAFVRAGGAIVDSGGFNLAIAQPLLNGGGGGGLTKNGSGILTLAGANTYTGDTLVNAGGLIVGTAHAGGGRFIVTNGATWGALLQTPGATLNVSSLFLGNITNGVVTNTFNFLTNATPSAPVIFATNLMTTGAVVVNVTGSTLTATHYPLMKYSGSIGGAGFAAFQLGSLPTGVLASLTNNTANQSVDLAISFVGSTLTWSGSVNDLWDIATTANWLKPGGVPTNYIQSVVGTNVYGDLVQFDDTLVTSRTNINVTTTVQPWSVTVSSSNLNYVFSGSGKLSGVGTLTKNRAGSLTISNANDYAGGTVIANGTVFVGNNQALGTGLVTLSGGGLAADAPARSLTNALRVTANSTLGDAGSVGLLTLAGPVDYNNATRDLTVASDTILTGAQTNGRINKLGVTNRLTALTIKSVVDWNGDAEVRDGILVFDGASVTNAGAIRPDSEQTNGLARMVVTNGTTVTLIGTGVNVRVGSGGFLNDTNTGYIPGSPTNILDIAGTMRMPGASTGNGRLQFGSGTRLSGWGIANLWPGGDLEVRLVQHTGSNYNSVLNFRGGVLRARDSRTDFMANLSYAQVMSAGAIIETDTNNVTIAQNLLAGDGGVGGLTKLGAGALLLNGTNTYTGTTVVSNGTLGGNGVIAGPVTVTAGGTLAPGAPFGNLTISNLLVLQGTAVMDVARIGSTVTNEQIRGLSSVTYGGTLQVTNAGTNVLASGDTFQLFSASSFAGKFSAIVPTTPGPGLVWDTRGLTNNGALTVISSLLSATRTNNQLVLSWSSNLIGVGWVQVQTNSRTAGLSTNWFDVPGSGGTNQLIQTINPASGTVFYRLVSP